MVGLEPSAHRSNAHKSNVHKCSAQKSNAFRSWELMGESCVTFPVCLSLCDVGCFLQLGLLSLFCPLLCSLLLLHFRATSASFATQLSPGVSCVSCVALAPRLRWVSQK